MVDWSQHIFFPTFCLYYQINLPSPNLLGHSFPFEIDPSMLNSILTKWLFGKKFVTLKKAVIQFNSSVRTFVELIRISTSESTWTSLFIQESVLLWLYTLQFNQSSWRNYSPWNTYRCLLWQLQNKPCFWSLHLKWKQSKGRALGNEGKAKLVWIYIFM